MHVVIRTMAKGSKSHRGNKTGAHRRVPSRSVSVRNLVLFNSVKGVSDRNKRTFKRHKTDAKNKTKSFYKRKPKQQTPKNKTQGEDGRASHVMLHCV